MKKYLTIFTAITLFAFFSCEKSELQLEGNQERVPDKEEITECETAFGSSDYCFSEDGFSRWGWVIGPLVESDEKTVHEIWAAAGGCVLENGTLVGYLYVDYYDGVATVTYDLMPGYLLTETHLYIGNEMYPTRRNGRPTVAPGQYPYSEPLDEPAYVDVYTVEGLSGEIYVIAHAVVCPGEIIKDDDIKDEEVPN